MKSSRAEQMKRALSVRTDLEAEATPVTEPPKIEQPAIQALGKPARTRERSAGKRSRGFVQVCILVPADLREDVQAALPLDPTRRDFSELAADLLTQWLAAQPPHVQAILSAVRQAKQSSGHHYE